MRVGLVLDGPDRFFRSVERVLCERHTVERFAPRFVRLPLIGKRVNNCLLTWQLSRFMRRNDIIFFEWAGPLLVEASRLPKHNPIIVRLHSVELALTAEYVQWPSINTVIVLSKTIQHHLDALVSNSSPNAVIVPNGVDLQRFHPTLRPFQYRLGMVCNLLPIKRVYEMLLALYQLRQDGQPFILHIAGKAGQGEAQRYLWAMQNLIANLQIQDAVIFDGYVENIEDWLQGIDVFVSNSYWEGQQVSLLEAMASGCYCLSHCWAGAEEVLPPEQIFTTDSDLRAKLLAYAALPEGDKHLAQARMRAIAEEKFDERRMIEQIIQVIEAVGSK